MTVLEKTHLASALATCSADAFPPPRFYWRFESDRDNNGSTLEGKDLTFRHPISRDQVERERT